MEELGEPLVVLGVSEHKADPILVLGLEIEDEIEERVAEAALGGVELDHRRLLPAR